MALTTYNELKAAVADWLNRADLTTQIPDFIYLAEATLNKILRSSYMITSGTASITSGAAAVPADALEIIYAQVQNALGEPLEQVSPSQLMMLRRNRFRSSGNPKFFAVVGRNIQVSPVPSGASTLAISYYQKIPNLGVSVSTNWLLQQAPDLYLYTSLMHALPFLQDDARTQLFNNMVVQQVSQAVQRDQQLTYDSLRTPGFSLDSQSDITNPPQTANVSPIKGVGL